MSKKAVAGLVGDQFKTWLDATSKAAELDLWARGEHEGPLVPRSATAELKDLAASSVTPWGALLVNTVAQVLAVTKQYAPTDRGGEVAISGSTHTFQEVWKASGMRSKQGAIYRAALGQNQAYAITLPGKRPHTGAPTARIIPAPATKMVAFYRDDDDEFAEFAIWGEFIQTDSGDGEYFFRVYDDEAIYTLRADSDGKNVAYITHETHPVGITPVHRFSPKLDLEGRAFGDVEPYLPVIRRLDQDTYDRLVVQRFNSWQTRTISGMEQPSSGKGGDEEGEPSKEQQAALAQRLKATDLLVSTSPDTKFGTLSPTNIEPFIRAHDSDVQDLAATSQTPPHHLLGSIVNLSADALAAAEASLMRKISEYHLSFGQSWDQVLRSCSFILAHAYRDIDPELAAVYEEEALDYGTEIHWADPESRSLSQAADALTKVAEGLGIPVEMLWEQLPFWKTEDTARAKRLIEEEGDSEMLSQFLAVAQRLGAQGAEQEPEEEPVDG